MCDEMHRSEPAPRAAAAPQSPAAPQPPAPAGAPRKVRRVGTFTMGLCLVIAGVALVVGMFRPGWNMLNLFKLTPLVLVALGAELLLASAAKGDTKLKYDFLSTVMCFFLLLAGFAGVVGMRMAEYASPETVQRLEAMEDEWDTAVGTALAGNEAVANAETYVNYNFSWPERTLVPQALAELGDGASANVTLAGEYEDVQAFLAAVQPVVQAVKGCGVGHAKHPSGGRWPEWHAVSAGHPRRICPPARRDGSGQPGDGAAVGGRRRLLHGCAGSGAVDGRERCRGPRGRSGPARRRACRLGRAACPAAG